MRLEPKIFENVGEDLSVYTTQFLLKRHFLAFAYYYQQITHQKLRSKQASLEGLFLLYNRFYRLTNDAIQFMRQDGTFSEMDNLNFADLSAILRELSPPEINETETIHSSATQEDKQEENDIVFFSSDPVEDFLKTARLHAKHHPTILINSATLLKNLSIDALGGEEISLSTAKALNKVVKFISRSFEELQRRQGSKLMFERSHADEVMPASHSSPLTMPSSKTLSAYDIEPKKLAGEAFEELSPLPQITTSPANCSQKDNDQLGTLHTVASPVVAAQSLVSSTAEESQQAEEFLVETPVHTEKTSRENSFANSSNPEEEATENPFLNENPPADSHLSESEPSSLESSSEESEVESDAEAASSKKRSSHHRRIQHEPLTPEILQSLKNAVSSYVKKRSRFIPNLFRYIESPHLTAHKKQVMQSMWFFLNSVETVNDARRLIAIAERINITLETMSDEKRLIKSSLDTKAFYKDIFESAVKHPQLCNNFQSKNLSIQPDLFYQDMVTLTVKNIETNLTGNPSSLEKSILLEHKPSETYPSISNFITAFDTTYRNINEFHPFQGKKYRLGFSSGLARTLDKMEEHIDSLRPIQPRR